MKKNEMGGACGTHWREERGLYKVLLERTEGKKPLGGLIDGRIILKWVLKNQIGENGLD
jgi:hypothetical protein